MICVTPATLCSGREWTLPRCGRDGPIGYPNLVVPLLPTERPVRRPRLPVQVERGRGALRGAQQE